MNIRKAGWRNVKISVLAIVSLGLLLSGCGSKSTGEIFPTKSVTLIVPYAAGGGTDVLARKIAPVVGKELGVSVIIENRPQGSTVPALNIVKEDKEGYTIIFEGALIASLKTRDIADLTPFDFNPIIVPQADPMAIIVPADSPWETAKEFISYVKSNPGEVQVGTSAAGGVNYSAAKLLENGGLPIDIIPFAEGEAAATIAMLGKRVDAVINSPSGVYDYVEAGKVRILAVGAEKPLPDLKDIPTFSQVGLNSKVVKAFRVVLAGPEVPKSHLKILESAFINASKSSEFQAFLDENRFVYTGLTGSDLTTYLQQQVDAYTEIYAE